jgi:hypothetical protein
MTFFLHHNPPLKNYFYSDELLITLQNKQLRCNDTILLPCQPTISFPYHSQFLQNGYTHCMDILPRTSFTWLKLAIIICWGVLFALLIKRDVFIETVTIKEHHILKQAESEEYQSIYFKKSKIGYVLNKYSAGPDSTWLLEQSARMRLHVAGTVQDIELKLLATLAGGNILEKFTFSFNSPFYRMKADGTVSGNSVTYTLETGTNVIHDTQTFDNQPFLATSRRGYLLSEGIQEGEKKKIDWFDPFSLTGRESVIEYRGKEPILIGGRIHNLHKFTESFSGTRVNSWLNDSGIIVKEESPAGFVFIKEPKFKALAISDGGEEILSSVAVKIKGEMVMPEGQTMQYRLDFPSDLDLDLAGGRQEFTNGILTLVQETTPDSTTGSVCTDIDNSLSPTPYVQSASKEIEKLVSDITSAREDQVSRVKDLGLWVYENIEKRPVLGIPDALTTLQNRQGDCNEHAALFAALARAASIPARIVAGVTYHKNAFYYHAWNEVCLGDQWISIDTTTNQFPADLSHLRFIQGEMQEQVRIGGLLGKLSIEPLAVSR